MSLEFNKSDYTTMLCKIHDQDVDPTNFDDSELPTDIHLVEYVIDDKTYYDAVRANKASDIFDVYYDKTKLVGGKVIAIRNGYGKIKPKLYNPVKTD